MNPSWILTFLGVVGGLGLGYGVYHWYRTWRDRIQCARDLPGLADDLGLEYKRSRTIGQIMGTVSGEYRGREIRINPHSGRDPLHIGTRGWASFPAEFATDKPLVYPKDGWITFDIGDPVFDRLFRTRYVLAAYADTIRQTPEIMRALVTFAHRWVQQISSLGISGGGAGWRLKISAWSDTFASDMWQPVEPLRRFIPELVDLLDLLQQHAPPDEKG